jgi:hypothetical protein
VGSALPDGDWFLALVRKEGPPLRVVGEIRNLGLFTLLDELL